MTEDVHDPVSRVCDRFEEAWSRGHPPNLTDFLLPAGDPSYLEALTELVATDIEFKSKRGDPVRLEDYISRFSLADESALLRLSVKEYRCRQQWGDCPDLYEYAERFPSLAHQLLPLLQESALDFCPTVVGIYVDQTPVFDCELVAPLEIGRQRGEEPTPYCVVDGTSKDRLVVADADESTISEVHCSVEAVAKSKNRITNHSPQRLPLDQRGRVTPGNYRVVELPVIIKLGHISIRLADR